MSASGSDGVPDRVREILERHGLAPIEHEPGSTPTAETAAARLGVGVGQIAKSILLRAKDGRFVMVVCAGDRRIDNRMLKAELGVKARLATAEETEGATGYRPGGVCPFAVEGIEVLVDRSLERFETVYPAAGTDASGVPMSFELLIEVSAGRAVEVTS